MFGSRGERYGLKTCFCDEFLAFIAIAISDDKKKTTTDDSILFFLLQIQSAFSLENRTNTAVK